MLRSTSYFRAVVPYNQRLFAIGRPTRTAAQQQARDRLQNTVLSKAFPGLAAMWVDCVGARSSLMRPNNLPCLSPKKQKWRCPSCQQLFEETVANVIDVHGQCPHCETIPTTAVLRKLQKDQQQQLAQKRNSSSSSDAARRSNPSVLGLTELADGEPVARKSTMRHVKHEFPDLLEKRSVDPMLAVSWLDVCDKTQFGEEPLWVSPKIDGVRCIITRHGTRRRVSRTQSNDGAESSMPLVFLTRRGAILECCDHLIPALWPLFEQDPQLALDGELFCPQFSFELLNGIIRTGKDSKNLQVPKLRSCLEFHAFDVMYSKHLNHKTATFPERYELLKKLFPNKRKTIDYANGSISDPAAALAAYKPFSNNVKLFHVPCAPRRQDQIDGDMRTVTEMGLEGIMIRRPGFPYGFGKRSNPLMKHKAFDTAEYIVLDVKPGIGRCTGQAASLVCATKDGIQFFATPKSEGPVRQAIWERRKEIIGKTITVQYQGLSKQQVPRFPVALAVRGSSDESDWF